MESRGRAHTIQRMTTTLGLNGKTLQQTPVIKAMHTGVLSCPPNASLRTVAELLAAHGVHAVVVDGRSSVSDTDAPWGVISALDLVGAALAGELDEQTAGASAATPVVMIATTDTLERAAQLMTEHGVTHLVVVDAETMHPVGVLSTLDIAGALSGVRARSGPPRVATHELW